MLYSDEQKPKYLGCMDCSEYALNSVHNEYGQYGSEYSQTSINNQYSQYGSPYSLYSACNELASKPPMIVDSQGNFYGLLTLNTYLTDRNRNPELLAWLKYKICS